MTKTKQLSTTRLDRLATSYRKAEETLATRRQALHEEIAKATTEGGMQPQEVATLTGLSRATCAAIKSAALKAAAAGKDQAG